MNKVGALVLSEFINSLSAQTIHWYLSPPHMCWWIYAYVGKCKQCMCFCKCLTFLYNAYICKHCTRALHVYLCKLLWSSAYLKLSFVHFNCSIVRLSGHIAIYSFSNWPIFMLLLVFWYCKKEAMKIVMPVSFGTRGSFSS